MNKPRGVMLGMTAVSQMRGTVRRVKPLRRSALRSANYEGKQGERRRVVVIGGLDIPASFSVGPTECIAAVLEPDDTGKLIDTERRITLKMFDASADPIADGTYGKAERLNGVWELYDWSCTASPEWEGLAEDPLLVEEEEPAP